MSTLNSRHKRKSNNSLQEGKLASLISAAIGIEHKWCHDLRDYSEILCTACPMAAKMHGRTLEELWPAVTRTLPSEALEDDETFDCVNRKLDLCTRIVQSSTE